jgi:hypothetical protein
LQQFLRRRLVAATAVAALLRHGGAESRRFRSRLARFAGRGLIANIDVAIAHDCYPLLKLFDNARLPQKVARGSIESRAPAFRFTVA